MATPLDSAPQKRRLRRNEFPNRGRGWSRRARAAVGAGIGTLALAGTIVASPSAALAQDQKITDSAQWAMDLMQVPAAQATTAGAGVTVAVVDTGLGEHPFFEDKNVHEGTSTFNPSEEPNGLEDQDGHGTQVAAGVLHVAPEATIMPIRYDNGSRALDLGGFGPGTPDSFRWAADNGADVIVFAWGSQESEDEDITEAVQYAIDKGVVVVVSAGNDPNSPPTFPASLPGVVAVTGTDRNGSPWHGNSSGPETVIAAPAEEILHPVPMEEDKGWGTEPEVEYEEGIAGTSVGAGFIGGVAALTLAANPDTDANNVIQRLIQTAGDGSGDRTDDMGFGLVNADQAVKAEGIETVDENPLGYPMGEAGASGAEPEGQEDGESSENAADDPAVAEGNDPASGASDSGLSTVIVVAAAVILIGAAVAVWMVLRGRSRKQAGAAMAQATAHGAEAGGHPQGGYPQSEPGQMRYNPPVPGPQGYGGPPAGSQQNYGPPSAGGGEPSPPWGPPGPNQRR